MASALLAFRLVLEVIAGCHCAGWALTPHGYRCVAPRDYPTCELVDGWHGAAPGVPTCSRACGEDV